MCGSDRIVSNTDDWNATIKPPLANTGVALGIILPLMGLLYQQAGFVEVDTRPSPNEGETEEFVISILPLDDPR